MRNAFTLVELAIVIVIIGLLVGGVLQGQELIRQAKISAQVKQIEDFNAAALTFKAKYGFIPGDIPANHSARFGISQNSYSNGDGQLSDYLGNVPTLLAYSEPLYFMIHLYQTKLIKDQMQLINNDYSVGKSFPSAKIGEGGIAAVGLLDGIYYYLGPTLKNDNGANSAAFTSNTPTPALVPSDAGSLDLKMDDGIPSSGIMRAVNITSSISTHFTNESTNFNNCLGASDKSYNYSTEQLRCKLIIRSKLN